MGSIHSTLLTKRLDFRTLTKIGVISTVISGSVGVYMAWADYGVWALAWQTVSGATFTTLLLWYFSSWRPLLQFSGKSFKRLMGFSGWIFASNMLNTIYQNGYTLLIGKFYGAYDLGIYNQADKTQQLPTSILITVVSRVTFPLFSSFSHDKQRLRRGVRLSVRSITLITAPSMLGLAVLAVPFIREVFGDKWLPAAPILQVLCLVGLLWPLHVINVNVLQAQGYASLHFRLAIIKKATGVVLLVIGSFFGVMGIAWSRVIQSGVALVINGHYTNKFLDYSALDQIKDYLPAIVLSTIMMGVVVLADRWIDIGGVIELLILIVIGSVSYIVLNVFLGIGAFRDAVAFLAGRKDF